jgi:conjugal transfer pilus assembly protein TraW
MRFINTDYSKVSVRLSAFSLTALLLWQASAWAEEDWLSKSRQILKALDGQERPEWLDGNPYQAEAQRQAIDVFRQSKSVLMKDAFKPGDLNSAIPKPAVGKPLRVMFISFSLGTAALKGIFQEASGQNDVLLVLRGPKPQQKLPALFAELKTLLKSIEPLPNIVIDPVRFQKYAVSSVPDMIIEDHGKASLHVKGVTSLAWLKDRQQQGKQGDQGSLGTVYAIAEMDLLAEMKNRLAAINWQQKKQQALARFWEQRQFEILPTALEDRDRLVDLTVTAPRDLTDPHGKLLVRAGQTVNPLDKLSFGLCLLVIDGTDQAQVNWLNTQSCSDNKARRMYLATQLPKQDGWEALTKLETALNTPVYLLTPDVRTRFQLQHVPTLIEQSGQKVMIRERKVIPSVSGESS